MKKYTIEYEKKEIGGNIEIPIIEKVEEFDSIGDQLGIDKEDNVLWFSTMFSEEDLNDEEVDDFLRQFFKNHSSVKGFIRRLII